jgi:hypothetical protein
MSVSKPSHEEGWSIIHHHPVGVLTDVASADVP